MAAKLRKLVGYTGAAGALVLAAPTFAFAATGKFAGGVFVEAMCDIFGLVEGDLGALLAATGGLIAICGAAFGSLRGTPSFVVTAIGAFSLSAGVSYGFGNFDCGTGTAARTVSEAAPLSRVATLPESDSSEEAATAPEAAVPEEPEKSDDPFDTF